MAVSSGTSFWWLHPFNRTRSEEHPCCKHTEVFTQAGVTFAAHICMKNCLLECNHKLEAASWIHIRNSTGGRQQVGLSQVSCYQSGISKNPGSGLSDSSGSPPAFLDHHRDHREIHTNTFQGALARTALLLGPDTQAALPDLHGGLYQQLLTVDFGLWKTNEKKLNPQIPSIFYLVIQHTSHKVAGHISFSFHLDTKQLLV